MTDAPIEGVAAVDPPMTMALALATFDSYIDAATTPAERDKRIEELRQMIADELARRGITGTWTGP